MWPARGPPYVEGLALTCYSIRGEAGQPCVVGVGAPCAFCAETRPFCGASCRNKVPKHVLQDAPVLEVVEFINGIDPADQRYSLETSVGRDNLSDQTLTRLELAVQPADRDLLARLRSEAPPWCPLCEDQR